MTLAPSNWPDPFWLVVNSASGSNSDEALAAVLTAFDQHLSAPARIVCFPDEKLPTAAELSEAGVGGVAIFTGDGTINALVTGLYGWDGATLVLPGGTMNLLSIVLHGDADPEAIITRVSGGKGAAARPPVVRSGHGDALAGLLVGPGTAWNDVREAMRDGDVLGLAANAASAIGESTSGSMVACDPPIASRDEGYSLVMLTPEAQGFTVEGYYAATIADYARQGLALLKRNFREGPHDDLGCVSELTVRSLDGAPMGLLIDGEPAEGGPEETFRLTACEVDLIATRD